MSSWRCLNLKICPTPRFLEKVIDDSAAAVRRVVVILEQATCLIQANVARYAVAHSAAPAELGWRARQRLRRRFSVPRGPKLQPDRNQIRFATPFAEERRPGFCLNILAVKQRASVTLLWEMRKWAKRCCREALLQKLAHRAAVGSVALITQLSPLRGSCDPVANSPEASRFLLGS